MMQGNEHGGSACKRKGGQKKKVLTEWSVRVEGKGGVLIVSRKTV